MKRICQVLLFLLCIFIASVSLFSQETETAEDITKKSTLNLVAGSGSVSRLSDRSVTSYCSAAERFELQISSETAICGIYLIWNHTPPSWELWGEDELVTGGDYGFWHEYKPLQGGTSYTLSWEGEGYLADVYLLGAGDLPEYVQVWEPPCEKADFLLLPTHADDEHLWFGGTMPYYAGELGYKIQVVYLMKHVYGRHHELINGLWTVGVRNYPVISEFIDKYCANLAQAQGYYPEEEVLAFLTENIRRFKPEVIVGHDLDGEYGHGAHILNAKVLSDEALAAANDPSQFPESLEKYGLWETKKCYLHLYQENEIFINWKEKELSAFGGINAYDMAQKGFEQHKSQVAFFSMSLDSRARYGNGLFGLYSTTVGPDILKNDFLENIPAECLTNWVEPEPEPSETIDSDTSPKTDEITDSAVQTTGMVSAHIPGKSSVLAITMLVLLVLACICIFLIVFLSVGKRRRKRYHRIK